MECDGLNLKKIVMISGDVYENVELVADIPEEIKSISEDLIGIRQGTDLIWINKTLIDSLQTYEMEKVEEVKKDRTSGFDELSGKLLSSSYEKDRLADKQSVLAELEKTLNILKRERAELRMEMGKANFDEMTKLYQRVINHSRLHPIMIKQFLDYQNRIYLLEQKHAEWKQ